MLSEVFHDLPPRLQFADRSSEPLKRRAAYLLGKVDADAHDFVCNVCLQAGQFVKKAVTSMVSLA